MNRSRLTALMLSGLLVFGAVACEGDADIDAPAGDAPADVDVDIEATE